MLLCERKAKEREILLSDYYMPRVLFLVSSFIPEFSKLLSLLTVYIAGAKRISTAHDHTFNTWKIHDLNFFLSLNAILCHNDVHYPNESTRSPWSELQQRQVIL